MARPIGFSMVLSERPENGARCDICTAYLAIGEDRVSTFIGTSPQSNVCLDCARLVAKLH